MSYQEQDGNDLKAINQKLAEQAALALKDMDLGNKFTWADISTSDPEEGQTSDVELGKGTAVPIPAKGSHAKPTQRQLADGLVELQGVVARSLIPYQVRFFANDVHSWLPGLREALPGSFDHLLLMLLDDLDSYTHLQRVMHDALSEYFVNHPDDEKKVQDPAEEGRSRRRNPGRKARNVRGTGRSKQPALSDPACAGNTDTRYSDEMAFFDDILVLRQLLAPLRRESKPIHWITNRYPQSLEMLQGLRWSDACLENLSDHIEPKLWARHGEWTIYNPAPPGSEARDKATSLHQWRIEASLATALWEKFPPDKLQLRDADGRYRLQLISSDPNLAREKGFLPPIDAPIPQPSQTHHSDICILDRTTRRAYREELGHLGQIARWLALARGFPAVHLFCDVVRLFTLYGIDVTNATQVRFVRFLTSKLLSDDDQAQRGLIPYIMGGKHPVNETNIEHFQDQLDSHRAMQKSLVETLSLFWRGEGASSPEIPTKVLGWFEDDSGKAVLEVDEEWASMEGFQSDSDGDSAAAGDCSFDLDDPAQKEYYTKMLFPDI
ncbi:hypothetical protein N7492_002402 [Penicillium capsulatum]|uniref:Uncharacterized protein n=1 Tax=Penicillium capsulatum TaxID=69766 RepID=A0A9W9IK06_9EURO|nr:hypothetical protein N7492_002402 [Penicillium capsulatum]KAJ6122993.1 hypothetical protein N7512_005458 [Penicillium capsulatum]